MERTWNPGPFWRISPPNLRNVSVVQLLCDMETQAGITTQTNPPTMISVWMRQQREPNEITSGYLRVTYFLTEWSSWKVYTMGGHWLEMNWKFMFGKILKNSPSFYARSKRKKRSSGLEKLDSHLSLILRFNYKQSTIIWKRSDRKFLNPSCDF